jgi:diphthamide biosynthesis protein 7
MSEIPSIQTTILDIPPSCIEVCPWDHSLIAIGTYLLEKNDNVSENETVEGKQPQRRSGSVLLFRLSEDQNSVELLHTQPCDYAILDLHFPLLRDSKELGRNLWTANSTGSLTCHELSSSGTTIEKSTVIQLCDPDVLVLAFTLHPKRSDLLGVTLSSGSVVLCQIPEVVSDESVWTFLPITNHDLEAWTMNFDLSGDMCLSGGDDAALHCNLLQGLSHNSGEATELNDIKPLLTWKNRRLHSAGVTAILPLSTNVVLTGSYDDRLRLVTLSKPPQLLTETNLGGGVWRLKLLSQFLSDGMQQYDILASCMHAGARIVRVTVRSEQDVKMEVLARFEEHESMNYGCDSVRKQRDDGGYEYTVLSTSFYDKKLCLWRFSAPAFESSIS